MTVTFTERKWLGRFCIYNIRYCTFIFFRIQLLAGTPSMLKRLFPVKKNPCSGTPNLHTTYTQCIQTHAYNAVSLYVKRPVHRNVFRVACFY